MSDINDALDNLEQIKNSGTDNSDNKGTSNGDCPSCGSDNKIREIASGNSSNCTNSNYVGGKNMNVVKKCAECGYEYGVTSGATGDTY
jgi:hypothetical protein